MRLFATGATIAVIIGSLLTGPLGHAAENQRVHRLAIHVDASDPTIMNLALNNAENAMEYYQAKGEEMQVEIVAYGLGLHMLRADTSPSKIGSVA